MLSSKLKWMASLVFGAVLLAACSPPPPPPDESTIVQVNVTGTANQNPDKNGRASPAIVHIYALKPGAPFDIGDPAALTGGELGPLAESMTRIAKMVIMPGRTRRRCSSSRPAPRMWASRSRTGTSKAPRGALPKPIKLKDVTLLKATIGSNAVSIE